MEQNELTNVEVEPVVIGDEAEATVESSGRDYLKDGLAIGAGLLALDGLYHVGKFVGVKVVKPAWTKVSTGVKNMKAKREANKAEKAKAKAKPVENTTE